MIYNLISVKRVISKVFTDLDLQEETHRISDMVEWAGEALEKIGAFPTLESFVSGKGGEPLVEISNYQAFLPIGLHSIQQIAYSDRKDGTFYPMRYGTGSFDSVVGMTKELEDPITGEIQYSTDEEHYKHNISYTEDLTYTITPGYIKTNVREGYLMISYKRVPIDKEGYPLIPDHTSFIEAVYWYIVKKLMYPKWQDGRVRDAVYYNAQSSWNYYCKQAYGTAMMPSGTDQLESIKNSWLRLVPELNEHKNMFSTLGQEQNIYNAN